MITTVVGLDLSLTSTGTARIEIEHDDAGHIVAQIGSVGTIASKGKRADTLVDRSRRLSVLATKIVESCIGADLVVIEGPAFSRSNPGMHDRSGLWWLVVDMLRTDSYVGAVVDIVEVSPTSRAKYATGKGNAGKDGVLAAVVRRYAEFLVMGNDEADAVVLAAMGARSLGLPIDEVPAVNRSAMDKVSWVARARGGAA